MLVFAGARGHVSLLNILTELKKACNHPFLFESAEDEYRWEDQPHVPAACFHTCLVSITCLLATGQCVHAHARVCRHASSVSACVAHMQL